MLYAQIALPLPLDDYYDYIIPDDLLPQIKIGCRVEVPFGHRIITGFCVNIQDFSKVENEKLKKIEKLIDVEPVISPSMIEFTKWWAKYYQCSLGEALEATVPKCVGVEKRRKSYHVILQDVLDIYRELEELQRRAPVQADIIRLLQENQGRMPREHIKIELKLKNIAPFKSLENKGLIVIEETEEELDIFSHLPLCMPPR